MLTEQKLLRPGSLKPLQRRLPVLLEHMREKKEKAKMRKVIRQRLFRGKWKEFLMPNNFLSVQLNDLCKSKIPPSKPKECKRLLVKKSPVLHHTIFYIQIPTEFCQVFSSFFSFRIRLLTQIIGHIYKIQYGVTIHVHIV